VQRLRHLVVIVPGIGGSRLAGSGDATRWELSAAAIGRTVIWPRSLDVEHASDLYPTGLVRSFTTFGPLLNVVGYEGLVSHLDNSFRDVVVHTYRAGTAIPANTDVLLFPYDFRRSVADTAGHLADAIGQALAGLHDSVRRDRVVVLAHSMGGLVARYWISALEGWRVCGALLTMGTPHRGAPKALDWLVNGPGSGRLRRRSVTRVIRGWPSMYELLPQYGAIWDEAAQTPIEPDRLPQSLLARRPELQTYASTFAAGSSKARRVHEDLAEAWEAIPAGRVPQVVTYFGRGHATVNLLTLTADGVLLFAKEDPPWRGNVGWAGDGTVPTLAAIPRELGEDRTRWRGLPERHGDLAATPAFLDFLLSYSGEPVPARGGLLPQRPWLGLDIEDVVPAGEPLRFRVRVQPDANAAEGVHVRLVRSGADRHEIFSASLTRVGDSWDCVLPGLPAGHYRLALEAQRVSGPESVYCRADFVALDPEDETERPSGPASGTEVAGSAPSSLVRP
jgi:hypothetical protein